MKKHVLQVLFTRGLPICLLVLSTAGCVLPVPLPSKGFAGHPYTDEATAFLDLPKTTREDVVSSLGLPSAEIHNPSVLLYTWETEGRILLPVANPGILHTWVHDRGLFIAFDQQGFVSAHETKKLGNQDLDTACEKWALSKSR